MQVMSRKCSGTLMHSAGDVRLAGERLFSTSTNSPALLFMKIQQGVMLNMLPVKKYGFCCNPLFLFHFRKGITADLSMCTLAMMDGWKCTINYTAR